MFKALLVHHLTKPREVKAPRPPLTTEQIEIRIWAFVVVVVMFVFAGITGSMLYSVIFVTQPIKSMAPIDQAFTKMLNDIVLLIVGGIGGIMAKKGVNSAATALTSPNANPYPCPPVNPSAAAYPVAQNSTWQSSGALPAWVNPALDESWTPGPPPTTPPDHLESDEEREHLAAARTEAGA